MSQGKTENKALENLIDALSLCFISCFERGTLFEVLKECGFAPASTKPRKRDFDKYIDVPIPFEVNKGVYNAQAVPSYVASSQVYFLKKMVLDLKEKVGII